MIAVAKNARNTAVPERQPSFLDPVVTPRAETFISRLRELRLPPSPSSLSTAIGARYLDERLYDALARAKVRTSQVAMHLDRAWRTKLFQQLDALLDAEEWESGDSPLQEASFSTFLRTMIALDPDRRPGLGLTPSGNLIAAWTSGQDRLTLEFLPNGDVRWLLSCYDDERIERAAGETSVGRLPAALAPYAPARWFGGYAGQPAS
jgi:hypothetical protein